jgi:putative transcription antitermination factor YqgF
MYIGIDYGKSKIGLAYSEGTYASSLGTISNTPSRISQINELLNKLQPKTYNLQTIILGIPNSPLDPEIYKFADELKAHFNCKIAFEDETLTTQEALENMIASGVKQKKRRQDDASSAIIILQRFLDNRP